MALCLWCIELPVDRATVQPIRLRFLNIQVVEFTEPRTRSYIIKKKIYIVIKSTRATSRVYVELRTAVSDTRNSTLTCLIAREGFVTFTRRKTSKSYGDINCHNHCHRAAMWPLRVLCEPFRSLPKLLTCPGLYTRATVLHEIRLYVKKQKIIFNYLFHDF